MSGDEFKIEDNDAGILLIGDASKAFEEGGAGQLKMESCLQAEQALQAAQRKDYDAIGIVMEDVKKLREVLRKLRQEMAGVPIVLLAKMHEEPAAIELLREEYNGFHLADDYLICPVPQREFFEAIVEGERIEREMKAAGAETMLRRKIRQLEKLAMTDDLTGLKNRRYIREFCRQAIENARQRNGQVTLLIFDIDDLKHYNDMYGHTAGDEILKRVAVLLKRCCRPHDAVGRLGGDEFVVIFWDGPGVTSQKSQEERRRLRAEHPREAISIANRFVEELKKAQQPQLGPKGTGVLTISGGLATYPKDGSTVDELFVQADRALLEAKRSGKNRIYLVGAGGSDITDIKYNQ
jgi:diguanylate cyclase (GGDEF)-like protein